MKGKLIVLEGIDGSGKETQSNLLEKKLKEKGREVMHISFPDYESPSSALVKMYLKGDFGKNPEDVNPYAASLFYAVDRFASYRMKWKDFYEKGGIVIADRYTTSNMVHQMTKYEDEVKEKISFPGWKKRNTGNWNSHGRTWSFFWIFRWQSLKTWSKKEPRKEAPWIFTNRTWITSENATMPIVSWLPSTTGNGSPVRRKEDSEA